jgi:hypothetical protein
MASGKQVPFTPVEGVKPDHNNVTTPEAAGTKGKSSGGNGGRQRSGGGWASDTGQGPWCQGHSLQRMANDKKLMKIFAKNQSEFKIIYNSTSFFF